MKYLSTYMIIAEAMGFNYVAVDRDGRVYMYMNEPILQDYEDNNWHTHGRFEHIRINGRTVRYTGTIYWKNTMRGVG